MTSLQIAHSGDPLLDAHVAATEELQRGDSWRFTRRGAGHCDATYAAAGAVHLARKLPPKPMVLAGRPTARRRERHALPRTTELRPLRELDEVAYMRFARVYRRFASLADFETGCPRQDLITWSEGRPLVAPP